VLGLLAVEGERIDDLDGIAQGIALAKLADDLGEDFADLVFQRVGVRRGIVEGLQIGKQFAVDEVDEALSQL
jgi:hypothetical protein